MLLQPRPPVPFIPGFRPRSGAPSDGANLLTNLVAYWSLEEASGTRSDVSAGSNDLTDNNTVTQNPGKVGNAAQFTAANTESLSIASNADLQTGDIAFTFALWVYLDSKGTDRNALSKFNSTGNQREYVIQFRNSADRFRVVVSNDGSTQASVTANNGGAPSLSTWYFLVFWHDPTANTINVQVNDGTADSAAHTTGLFTGSSAFLLGNLASGGGPWNGRIDEVGFWKRLLTTAEKTWLYNSGNGRAFAELGT